MRKKWFYFLIIIFLLVLFRTALYKCVVGYESVKERHLKTSQITNKRLKSFLENNKSNHNIKDIVSDAVVITAEDLVFSFGKCNQEVNLLADSKNANCIGYASYFNSIINYKLIQNNMDKDWKVTHEVAEIYVFGKNVHPYLKSDFFKDHDFVTVENVKTKEIIAVDATVYDYFKIKSVRVR